MAARETRGRERRLDLHIPNSNIRVPNLPIWQLKLVLLLASIAIEAVDGELINELVKTLNLYGLEHLLTIFFCTSNIKDKVLPWLNNWHLASLAPCMTIFSRRIDRNIETDGLNDRREAPLPKTTSIAITISAQHSLAGNPQTLQVASIVDCEFCGFYPRGFEIIFLAYIMRKKGGLGVMKTRPSNVSLN